MGTEVKDLIWQMARENPTWGVPRIHGELLKLGVEVSERTVSRYLPRRPSNPDKIKQWKTLLSNHRDSIAAMDFFTIPTVAFRMLYGFFVIHHGRRLLVHLNVTFHPTAEWVIQQLRNAFPYTTSPGYLLFDRDCVFSARVREAIRAFGMRPVRTGYRSPWFNGVAERWIGSCRRELLDHVIVLSEDHARRLWWEYGRYYNADRCHLGLGKDTPSPRWVQKRPSDNAGIAAFPRLGGLQHRYEWRAAA